MKYFAIIFSFLTLIISCKKDENNTTNSSQDDGVYINTIERKDTFMNTETSYKLRFYYDNNKRVSKVANYEIDRNLITNITTSVDSSEQFISYDGSSVFPKQKVYKNRNFIISDNTAHHYRYDAQNRLIYDSIVTNTNTWRTEKYNYSNNNIIVKKVNYVTSGIPDPYILSDTLYIDNNKNTSRIAYTEIGPTHPHTIYSLSYDNLNSPFKKLNIYNFEEAFVLSGEYYNNLMVSFVNNVTYVKTKRWSFGSFSNSEEIISYQYNNKGYPEKAILTSTGLYPLPQKEYINFTYINL